MRLPSSLTALAAYAALTSFPLPSAGPPDFGPFEFLVIRARRAEEILASGGAIEDARRALEREIAPIDDLRSTAAYRRRVAGNVLDRFWRESRT